MAAKIILLLLFISTGLCGQVSGTDKQIAGELKMTFPGIYFKNNSTDYASMPYSVDSCFKYIAAHVKDIYNYSIWRDSTETDQLTNDRIKKLKAALNQYAPSDKINIVAMGKTQKISQKTIDKGISEERIQYLLSLNSVLDISTTGVIPENRQKLGHEWLPRPWCLACWKHGFFIEYRRNMRKARKIEKRKKAKNASKS